MSPEPSNTMSVQAHAAGRPGAGVRQARGGIGQQLAQLKAWLLHPEEGGSLMHMALQQPDGSWRLWP